MTIAYRETDPVSSRWTGLGRLLTAYEVDYNFYQHETRLGGLEASITTTVSVSSITSDGTSLVFHMSDSSMQGPFTMPTSVFRDRGTWTPTTAYFVNDTFNTNGTLYRVLFAHTSGATFSPSANDGAGHNYYAAMVTVAGNALPSGGAPDMMLRKSTSADYSVSWSYPLPSGGTQYQVLMKNSNTTQDASWATVGAGNVAYSPSTVSGLTSSNVADAIEEVELSVQALVGTINAKTLLSLTDVQFATNDPRPGSLLVYGGSKWSATAPATASGQVLTFNGTQWVGGTVNTTFAGLTDTQITSPAPGDTLVYDRAGNPKWVNRKAYINLGPTGTDVGIGDTDNYATIRFTPTASLQIGNGSYSRLGEKTTLIIVTSGSTSYNITAASTVVMNGTLATGTVSGKVFILTFLYDFYSGNIYEISRSVSDTTDATAIPVQSFSATGTTTIDLRSGPAIKLSLIGNASIVFTNPLAAGSLNRVVLEITNTGAFDITSWPSGTTFAGGAAPSITHGSGKVDVVTLVSLDGGTTWRGALVGQDFS